MICDMIDTQLDFAIKIHLKKIVILNFNKQKIILIKLFLIKQNKFRKNIHSSYFALNYWSFIFAYKDTFFFSLTLYIRQLVIECFKYLHYNGKCSIVLKISSLWFESFYTIYWTRLCHWYFNIFVIPVWRS